LTVLSALVCAICIVRLSRELTCRRGGAALAAMTFLTSLPLYHWIAVHRPDLPALAMAFGAIALAFPARHRTTRHATGLVVILLVAAFYFKQTTVLPIGVVIVRYLQTGRFKQALIVLFGVLGTGAAIAAALGVTSSGGYFWQHFVLTRHVPYSYGASLKWLGSICRSPSYWIAVGLIAAGARRQVGRLPGEKTPAVARDTAPNSSFVRAVKSPRLLFLSYLVVAAAVAFITSARSGSYVNYYLEPSMVLAVVVAIGWDWLAEFDGRRRVFLAIVGLFVLAAGIEFWRMLRAEAYRWKSLGYYRGVVETLKREVPPERLVVSVHPELAVASGHRYYFGDFIQYADGRSPELRKVIADEFGSKRFGAIVWLTPDDPKLAGYKLMPMKNSVHEKYYPVYLFFPE